jgi:hypothetical protein
VLENKVIRNILSPKRDEVPLNLVIITRLALHVKWVPCHHGKARPQVADGGDALQFWREAANILNKKSRRADKG